MAHGQTAEQGKHAQLYRMVMEEHLCPFGLKSKDLLERKGFAVEDHHLTTREETEEFKQKHDVDTTPQAFIDGQRIGGYDELREYFGKDSPDENETTYQPVIALFATALLMGLAVSWTATGSLVSARMPEYFVAIAMTLLGLQKLKDVESFSTMFLNYDLLAQRQVRYGYVYPYAETLAGILMLAGALVWLAAPVALFIGTVGAVSVFKAVYIDKRELKCACVGGDSKVPLGFVSLTENLIMVSMGIWMPLRMYVL
ncbi:MauE/DoxX family redox-associated membrane protein [Billgrantia antri]|uniref:MauE/DoxX family redox-associated membrane protein n=1 Tax=Billgrantia antri TaxID=2846777 RepID=UPI003B226E86